MAVTVQEQETGTGIGAGSHGGRTDVSARATSTGATQRYARVDSVPSQVGRLRTDIERIDRAIVNLIAERVQVASEIGGAKQAAGVPLVDPAREAAIVRQAADLARTLGLPEEDVRDVFWRLVALARRTQLESLSGAA